MAPKKSQMRHSCAFCGQPGSSRAHVIAQMFHQILGDFPTSTTWRGHAEWDSGRGAFGFTERFQSPQQRRSLLGMNAKRVCRDCNSGWMSRVESAAREPLENLIQAARIGLHVPISSAAATNVARWAVMTAWMLELSGQERNRGPLITTSEMRRELSASQMPPANALVAVGQWPDDNVFTAQAQVAYDDGGDDDPERHMLTTVLPLGKLVIYVATFDHVDRLRPAPRADRWKRIWPNPDPVTHFPPHYQLSIADIDHVLKDYRGWLGILPRARPPQFNA